MLSTRRARIGIAMLVLAALAVRVALVLHTPGYQPRHDDHDYVRVAWSMAQGAGYPAGRLRLGHGRVRVIAQAWRPPLWPAVLAGTLRVAAHPAGALPHRIPALTAARLANALLGTLAVLLTAALAGRIWGARAGWWAGALAAVYLPLALLSTVLFSETLFVCLEVAALLVALEGRSLKRAAAAGVLVGLAWLTRLNGVALLAPVLLLLVAAGGPRRARRAAVAGVACLAVVAPWTMRNAQELHAFVPVSTETGGTLAGVYNAAAMRDRASPGAWHLLRDTPYRHALAPGTPPAAADRKLRSLAADFALHHPSYVWTLATWNLRRLLGLAGRDRWRFEAAEADIGPRSADAAIASAWVLIALAVASAAAGLARRAPGAVWLAAGLLLLSTVLANAESARFRAPLEPFLLGLAGAGLARLSSWWRARAPARAPTRTAARRAV